MQTITPLIFASYKSNEQKETITSLVFASYKSNEQSETITPLIFASYMEKESPRGITLKSLIFASYEGEPSPTPTDYLRLTPTGVGISKRNEQQTILKPLSVVSKRNEQATNLQSLQLAVTFYTPTSVDFFSKYNPQIAVSFVAPDKRYYFRSNYQENLLFFPPELNKFAWNSIKTLTWENKTAKSGSGKIRTLTTQISPKITIETKLNHITDKGVEILFDFIRKVDGATKPFLWWDEDSNTVKDIELLRDAFGYYRLPFHPLDSPYMEYAWYIDDVKVTLGDEILSNARFEFYRGAIIILDANGYEIKTTLPKVKASFKYWWKVRFVDDGQGIERIFYDFNRSKTIKIEVVRRV